MKKKKGKSILMVVGIIAVAVILANWVVPGVMLAVEANSKLTQADAQALMDQYDGEVSQKDLMEYTGKAKSTVQNWVDEHPGFLRENGIIRRVQRSKNDEN